MRGIKIPRQEFALKMQWGGGGGAYVRGGAYLRDTTRCCTYIVAMKMYKNLV